MKNRKEKIKKDAPMGLASLALNKGGGKGEPLGSLCRFPLYKFILIIYRKIRVKIRACNNKPAMVGQPEEFTIRTNLPKIE